MSFDTRLKCLWCGESIMDRASACVLSFFLDNSRIYCCTDHLLDSLLSDRVSGETFDQIKELMYLTKKEMT